MRRLVVAPVVLAGMALIMSGANAAGPQITDPPDDANFVNSQGNRGTYHSLPHNTATPVGSQEYADVLSVEWKTLKTTKKVKRKKVTTITGFSVTTVLKGAPKPPDGTTIVYRMLGKTADCPIFGVVYYTSQLSDPTTPQSAIRDDCVTDNTIRLTKINPPVIKDKTITWTVPLSAIPKDTKVKAGSTLTELYFTVVEIEDLKGQKIPDNDVAYGGATGFGVGVIDDSRPGDASFRIA